MRNGGYAEILMGIEDGGPVKGGGDDSSPPLRCARGIQKKTGGKTNVSFLLSYYIFRYSTLQMLCSSSNNGFAFIILPPRYALVPLSQMEQSKCLLRAVFRFHLSVYFTTLTSFKLFSLGIIQASLILLSLTHNPNFV